MSDSWIVKNRARVQRLLYKLDEIEMMHTYEGTINFPEVKAIIRESFKEINRLEGMLKLKNEELTKTIQENEEIKAKISQATTKASKKGSK